jgi:uncharacterized metal-binding protein YceD (DUF177 family)
MRSVYIAQMQTEFSHPIRAGHIHGQPQIFALEASEEALAALAQRFGLPAIAALSGRFTLQHERGGVIAAALSMRAQVTQLCVITMEPFEAEIAEEAVLRFVPACELKEEEDFAPESLGEPDEIPYENDVIDLGEALAEQLALALEPYPRKPGAALPDEAQDDGAHPFAALKGKFGKPS